LPFWLFGRAEGREGLGGPAVEPSLIAPAAATHKAPTAALRVSILLPQAQVPYYPHAVPTYPGGGFCSLLARVGQGSASNFGQRTHRGNELTVGGECTERYTVRLGKLLQQVAGKSTHS
jgi:hypothetical protein